MLYLIAALVFFLGVFVGLVINNRVKRSIGTLLIDQNSMPNDIYRIEFNDLESISRKKYALLKIRKNVDLSQK